MSTQKPGSTPEPAPEGEDLETVEVGASAPEGSEPVESGPVPPRADGWELEEDPADDLVDDEDDDFGDFGLVPATTTGPSLLARVGAEALGVYVLVLVSVGVALYTSLSGAGALGSALASGLVLAGGMAALAHVSGGHLNPVVTLGSALAGRTDWRDLVPYWLAQVLGACAAVATLFVTIPTGLPAALGLTGAQEMIATTANGWGEQSPLWVLSQQQVTFDLRAALVLEVVAGAVLVAVYLGSTSSRAARGLAPFAVGLAYAALVLLTAPVTNGAVHPALATGTALFAGSAALGQLWLFWVAPLVGAAVAGLVHQAFSTDQVETLVLLEETDLVEEQDVVVTPSR
ncbi:aquaporin [Actinotalea sp. K2]|uniref:aquaporin n=1 Tax=Actinotalea sp. K2 TaxID=2939438 RepID=UPI00201728D8|nr:aquaporin [Actinotalea sp. K2]MCL3859900.1 aquaporin [Actinotalea sp. K2]